MTAAATIKFKSSDLLGKPIITPISHWTKIDVATDLEIVNQRFLAWRRSSPRLPQHSEMLEYL